MTWKAIPNIGTVNHLLAHMLDELSLVISYFYCISFKYGWICLHGVLD